MNKSIKTLLLCSLAMLITFAGSNIFSNVMASSSDEERYKSYERDDYKKSKSFIVNENNCINNNNINVNTIGNSDVVSSGGLVATEEDGIEKESYPNTYATNEDRYNKQNDKGVSCIINNSNSIITTDDDNSTDVGNIRPTCEECFEDWLTSAVIDTFLQLRSENDLSDLCTMLLTTRTDRESFITDLLMAGATEQMANNLVDCLVWSGVRFT